MGDYVPDNFLAGSSDFLESSLLSWQSHGDDTSLSLCKAKLTPSLLWLDVYHIDVRLVSTFFYLTIR